MSESTTPARKFRKKPVVIEAIQYTAAVRDAHVLDGAPLPAGVRISAANFHPERREVYRAEAYIEILEGRMEVALGDWVITGIKGEHYPCKPDIFEATYALADTQCSEPALTDEQIDKIALEVVYEGDETIPYRKGWCEDVGRPFARAIERAALTHRSTPEPDPLVGTTPDGVEVRESDLARARHIAAAAAAVGPGYKLKP